MKEVVALFLLCVERERDLLRREYGQLDEAGLVECVVDALSGLFVVGGFAPENVGDEGLRHGDGKMSVFCPCSLYKALQNRPRAERLSG